MINKLNIKILTIIFFLIIVFPSPHAPLPNFIVLIIIILQDLFMIDEHYPSIDFYVCTIALFSILLFFFKKRTLVLVGTLIQYLYLFYIFKAESYKYWYFTLPTIAYVILSTILIYILFSKNKINST